MLSCLILNLSLGLSGRLGPVAWTRRTRLASATKETPQTFRVSLSRIKVYLRGKKIRPTQQRQIEGSLLSADYLFLALTRFPLSESTLLPSVRVPLTPLSRLRKSFFRPRHGMFGGNAEFPSNRRRHS